MDAVEFLKEKNRLCDKYTTCVSGCPIIKTCNRLRDKGNEETVAIVEKWSKEHSIITNADKFKEVFGIEINSFGNANFIQIVTNSDSQTIKAIQCLDEFWDEPYKKPEV